MSILLGTLPFYLIIGAAQFWFDGINQQTWEAAKIISFSGPATTASLVATLWEFLELQKNVRSDPF